MRQSQFFKSLAIFGASFFLGVTMHTPVSANKRIIFNENPTTIEHYFGKHWSRLTTTSTAGDRVVTYTYNPQKIRSLFLNAEKLRLSIDFVNNRAERITIDQDGNGFDIPPEQLGYPNYYPTSFNNLFEYVFGYFPSTSEQFQGRLIYDDSGDGGTLHVSKYCLTKGIAISYEWISIRTFIYSIEIIQEKECI